MKRIVSCAAGLVMMAAGQVQAIETKIGMEVWGRYTAHMSNATWQRLANNTSQFAIERGYFNVQPKFNDSISGRFTIDVYSKRVTVTDTYIDTSKNKRTTVTNSSGKLVNVITNVSTTSSSRIVNEGATVRLKYAWVDFKLSEGFPLPESQVSVGLIKHIFGTIYDWDYPMVEKAIEDKYGYAASADYGVSLNGYIPMGFGEYALSLYNGEGYTKTGTDVEENPEWCGNVRLIPIPGVTVGFSYSKEHKRTSSQALTFIEKGREMMAGVLRFNMFQPLDIWMEALQNFAGAGTLDRAYMVFGQFSLMPFLGIDFELTGRYDILTTETKSRDDLISAIGGLNCNILRDDSGAPQMVLMMNWDRTGKFNTRDRQVQDKLLVQLKYKFGATIAN